MSSDRDERLGRLGEELAAALAAGAAIAPAAFAARFEVTTAEVAAAVRALQALDLSLGEEAEVGSPELPAPRLPDDYQLLGEVGRGGMGVVYRAHQRSLGRDVAVKVLRPGDLVFGAALRRFRAEARSLARLRHRHIVSVHDLGESEDGTLWFAMDLIDGGTLADELARVRRFLPSRAVRTVRQVASAVVHAHAQGIVHRDLKPQNVLLDAQGDAFVVDFGLARDSAAAGTRTMTGELLGTPAYMSPEQASGQGDRIGEASDVWALGALLYELLTGRGPFAGKPLHETIRAILEDEPIAPQRLDPRIPGALAAISLKALRKRPEDRYATALAFAEDLERFASGHPVAARPPGPLPVLAAALRRRARGLGLALLAVCATLLAVQLWLPSLRRGELLAAAERLCADGRPAAAVAAVQDLGRVHPLREREQQRAELVLLRSHNDLAAERWLAGDRRAAGELAAVALGHAERYERSSGVVFADGVEVRSTYAYELLRAQCFLPDREAPDFAASALLPLALLDLRSHVPTRALHAALVVSRARLVVAELADAERVALLERLVLSCSNQLAAGAAAARHEFPWVWHGADHDTWWSPAVEAAMARLAGQTSLPAWQRVVAGRILSVLSGLPACSGCAELPGSDPLAPSVAAVAAAAGPLAAAWQAWQALPIAERLAARVDWLVAAAQAPGQALPGAQAQIVPTLQRWLGTEVPTGDDLPGWWALARQLPYANLIGRALGPAVDQVRDVATALDRSVLEGEATAMLWRQWAWLQVPAAPPLPWADATTTQGGMAWRQQVLAAAGSGDPQSLVVRGALLRFDDAEPTPQLLGQVATPARIGEPVQLRLQGWLPDTPWLSVREHWEDDALRHEQERPLRDGALVEMPADPRFGQYRAELRGQVLLDQHGVRVEGRNWLRCGVDGRFDRRPLRTAQRVWLGTAASGCGETVASGRERRLSTFLWLLQLDSGSDLQPLPLAAWHRAVQEGLQAAERAAVGSLRRASADWLTAAWWAMPEAASALQRLAGPDGLQASGPHCLPAWVLAGVEAPEALRGPAPPGQHGVLQGVRLLLGTNSPAQRERELQALARQPDRVWSKALATQLQQAAATLGLALPVAVQAELDAELGWFRVLGRWCRSPWLLLGSLVGAGLLVRRRRGATLSRSYAAGLVAMLLLVSGSLRLQVAGVVLTPPFVVAGLAFWVAARGAPEPWRSWRWHRWLGFGLFAALVGNDVLSWWALGGVPAGGFPLQLLALWLLVWEYEGAAVRPRRRGNRVAKALP